MASHEPSKKRNRTPRREERRAPRSLGRHNLAPTLVMSASPTPGGVAKIRDENVRGDVRVQVRRRTNETDRFAALVGRMVVRSGNRV
jgi:hypothetical protein